MHFVKSPGFWRVVESFRESRGGGQLCLGKQCSEMPDQRVFTYFSGCWVPEVSDTKKYQNKGKEQQAEEQSAELVPGAALLPRLGCFCLLEEKAAMARLAEAAGGRGQPAPDPAGTAGMQGGRASRELTSRKRQCSAVPPMVSSVCEEPARSEVESGSLWLHTRWEGRAEPPPRSDSQLSPALLAPPRWLSQGQGHASL